MNKFINCITPGSLLLLVLPTSPQPEITRKLTARARGEYIQSWRVLDSGFAAGQILRSAAESDYRSNHRWDRNASLAGSQAEEVHACDNTQCGFFISYNQPLRRAVRDSTDDVPVEYPLRFSFGIQQPNGYNFPGRSQAIVRPLVRLTPF